MKRKLLAILLAVSLMAGFAVCIPATAADYDGQVNVDALVEYGKKMYSAHEGNYDSVVQNDSGAVGMGILGWRGYSALRLLKMICSAAPELSKQTLGSALYNEIVNTALVYPNWDSRPFNATEAANTRILLGTQVGHDCEDELARQDITRQIGEAWKQGIRSDAAILYYCSISNHYGPGGAQTFMKYIRTTLGITSSDLITSLEVFHGAVVKAANSYSYVKNTLAYRTKIYNYIKNVLCLDTTGQVNTPITPPAPECPDCPSAGFTDVPAKGTWAHDGIDYVLSHGLFKGTSATTFSPNGEMTRAMLVTVLYRMEGSPEVDAELPFTDVPEGSYFEAPVVWAASRGIVNGVSEDSFAPNQPVTREQMAVILYRYDQMKGGTAVNDPMLIYAYGDCMRSAAYAREALSWAIERGIIQGSGSSGELLLQPDGKATRAQVATILTRYLTN